MKRKQIEHIDTQDRCGDISLDVPGVRGRPTQAESLQAKEYDSSQEHPTPEQLLIRQAVRYLTPKQRKVWELWNYDKMTQDEIAKTLGKSRTTIETQIQQCEKRIERYCKANMGAYELLKSDLGEQK